MTHTARQVLALASASLSLALAPAMAATTTTFEGILPSPGTYWNGGPGSGSFTVDGATYGNSYNPTYQSWSGFAFSNTTDKTTAGYGNQYSAYPGSGAGGSPSYAVGTFAPVITFSQPSTVIGASITNTTYAALSMLQGDSFAKKFGGSTGNDPDFFLLTIRGYSGATQTGAVDFYLADYRFADNSQDYIVSQWTNVDLSSLGTVDRIEFSFSSSDNGDWGMNTPAYLALDNLAVSPVPEVSTFVLSLLGIGPILRRRRA